MLANMACSFNEHKRINTTVAKTKAKTICWAIITKSKKILHTTVIIVFAYLRNKYGTELFLEM
jgi:ribosomal protein L17